MIYKFKKDEQGITLELEHIKDELPFDAVEITISKLDYEFSIQLHKEDVYRLIGALHLIQKEMK